MKRLLTLLVVLSLVGCAGVPVARHFPDVPEELNKPCLDLKETDPNTVKLSEVITVVADNYSQYHECRFKVEGWIEWYKSQKEIFDSVK